VLLLLSTQVPLAWLQLAANPGPLLLPDLLVALLPLLPDPLLPWLPLLCTKPLWLGLPACAAEFSMTAAARFGNLAPSCR
jgi:hypothetical protein